jgi:hypothetical protein
MAVRGNNYKDWLFDNSPAGGSLSGKNCLLLLKGSFPFLTKIYT